ncbi:hypothetical protein Q1695_008257 [Nippostrongylus brasiliensis]|nr:hypothetical protein Q1695_008257 [Nippostrongylus brasiliensis]
MAYSFPHDLWCCLHCPVLSSSFLIDSASHYCCRLRQIIARRCRESLSYFSLSCDDNGKLIVKPTVRMSPP